MSTPLTIRTAALADVPAILALYDAGAVDGRPPDAGNAESSTISAAFAAIDADPNNHLLVATIDAEVVGTLQLTFIPGLARTGGWRCLVESVFVDAGRRGTGIGAALMDHAISAARAHGCVLVQLTSNNQRTEAHRFYERLGFVATHQGFKLKF